MKLLFICFAFFLISCNANQSTTSSKKQDIGIEINSMNVDSLKNIYQYDDYVLSLNLYQYPLKEVLEYRHDTSGISIGYLNELSVVDSILFRKKTKFTPDIFDISNALYKDSYINKCIEDGQNMALIIYKNDTIIKNVKFCNIYNDTLNYVIDFFNSNVDKKFRINYNKKKLIEYMRDCQ